MTISDRESGQLTEVPPVGVTTIGGDAPVASPPVRRRARKGIGWPARFEIALMTGPTLLVYAFFVIFPVAVAAFYGFYSWQGYGPPTDFVGFRNYVIILQDKDFLGALWHNAMVVVLSLVIQGPAAVLLALLLNRKMRGQTLIRVLVFVPYVIAEVVVGTGLGLMLQGDGAVNSFLTHLGLGGLRNDWLSNPGLAIWTLIGILTWKYIGFAVLLFLAGLQGIPAELTEAAATDGASYWQIQRRITLPLLGPTIRIWAFLSMIGALQLFDLVYIIWGQYVASTAGTSTMVTYMVANGRNAGEYGYGNAVAVVLFLVSLAAALFYQRFGLRRDTEGAITGGRN